jgi:hypothetical protein
MAVFAGYGDEPSVQGKEEISIPATHCSKETLNLDVTLLINYSPSF